jgi:hypothetical protein
MDDAPPTGVGCVGPSIAQPCLLLSSVEGEVAGGLQNIDRNYAAALTPSECSFCDWVPSISVEGAAVLESPVGSYSFSVGSSIFDEISIRTSEALSISDHTFDSEATSCGSLEPLMVDESEWEMSNDEYRVPHKI